MTTKIENVADYPRPPALERVTVPIVVEFGGRRIAEASEGFRVLETYHPPTYYVPMSAFADASLKPSEGRSSFCEWKGRARYFDIVSGDKVATAAAWTYPDPTPRFVEIREHVALYAEPMDRCIVGGEVVQPQPGNFYGGWVTSNITGPIKGAAGTNHW
ncbi:MAG: DUF427 domain-containing protein [Pseudomonadota bacterium]